MRTFSEVDVLGINPPKRLTFWQELKRAFSKANEFNLVSIELVVPVSIVDRTEILCEYFNDKNEINFEVQDLVMQIYREFTNKCMKKYDSLAIHKEMSRSYGYSDSLVIKNYVYNQEIIINKEESKKVRVTFDMKKREARQGELLLSELYQIHGHYVSLEELLATLWVNFIEEYKRGENTKQLNEIVKLLRNEKRH